MLVYFLSGVLLLRKIFASEKPFFSAQRGGKGFILGSGCFQPGSPYRHRRRESSDESGKKAKHRIIGLQQRSVTRHRVLNNLLMSLLVVFGVVVFIMVWTKKDDRFGYW